ncbi:MAG: hypothetical protein ACKERG_04115 [Candidatus Hodgkinia cicadicola]
MWRLEKSAPLVGAASPPFSSFSSSPFFSSAASFALAPPRH